MSDGNPTSSATPETVTPENIAALSAFIFDLDGVIWRGGQPIEGAVEAVQRLKAAGKTILYCTNNSTKAPAHYAERLRGMGLELEDEDVLTSSWATAVYLSAQFTGPFSVFVVGEEGIINALQKTGARIVPEHDVDEDTRVDCVVVGLDRSFNYERLKTAQQLILRGAQFVATNRDSTFPVENGVVPGSGAVVAAVEAASGMTPVTIGKPRPAMLQLALERFNLQTETTAIIGDRLDTDIAAGRNAGILALFVATGVTTPAQARKSKGQQRPHALFPNLSALCQLALEGKLPESEAAPQKDEAEPSADTAPTTPDAEESTPVVAEEQPVATDSAEEAPPTEAVTTEPVADDLSFDREESQATEDETQADGSTSAPAEASAPAPSGNFSFADAAVDSPTTEEEAPSTAAEQTSGQIAEDMAEAPDVAATTEPPAMAEPATKADDDALDLSELEGIEWGDDGETSSDSNDLARSPEESPNGIAPAASAKNDENPDDPFSSWFESVDEKK